MTTHSESNHRGFSRRRLLQGAGAAFAASGIVPDVSDAAPVSATGGASTWFNARNFGAVGDGRHDDTAAINAACSAARASGGVGVVYLPTGSYSISSTVNVWNVSLKGDGQGATRVSTNRDWASAGPNSSWMLDQQPSSGSAGGVGLPAPDSNHLGTPPQPGTWIEDLWLNGPGGIRLGTVPCNLSGIRVGQNAGYSRLRVDGFYAGAFLFAGGEKLYGPGSQGGNYYALYYGEPAASTGGSVIVDMQLDGGAWASIGVSPNRSLMDASFRKLHLGSQPFGIYKEAGGSTPVLENVLFNNVSFESCGNGNIFVGGAGGADVRSCVFDGSGGANSIDPGGQVGLSTTDSHGTPIGRLQAVVDIGTGSWSDNLGAPLMPHAGWTGYQAMLACGAISGGGLEAEDFINRVVADGKIFTSGSSAGGGILQYRNTECRLWAVATGSVRPNDLIEAATVAVGCQQSRGSQRVLGVALHGGAVGQAVPVAYRGVVTVSSGSNTVPFNAPIKADPSQPGCVMPASSSSDPGVIGVAYTAAGSGSLVALLRGL